MGHSLQGGLKMDFTGKVMKGYVFVDIDALDTKKKLEYWVKLALDFNKIAKASKNAIPRDIQFAWTRHQLVQ